MMGVYEYQYVSLESSIHLMKYKQESGTEHSLEEPL